MPTLDEGDLLYTDDGAGLSIGDARLLLQQVDALIASEPVVKSVFARSAGRQRPPIPPRSP